MFIQCFATVRGVPKTDNANQEVNACLKSDGKDEGKERVDSCGIIATCQANAGAWTLAHAGSRVALVEGRRHNI